MTADTPRPAAPAVDDPAVRLDLGDVLEGAEPAGAYGDLEPAHPPLVDEHGRVRLSFSRIDTYRSCPLRFRYSYIDRLPSRPATHLSFGTSVHGALEAFHDRTLFGMPSEQDLLGFLYDAWDSSGFAHVTREVQLREYRRAQDVLRRYHRRVADSYQPAADTEKWFELPVDDVAVVVGSIDRIDVDDAGEYHVVDYKTGKLRDQQQVRRSLQLSIYALACRYLYGVLPSSVSLDFVVAGTEVRVPVHELDLDGARAAVRDTASAVLAERYEPRPSRLCDWCDHRAVCPAWEGDQATALGPVARRLDEARREASKVVAEIRSLEATVERLQADLGGRGPDPLPAPEGDPPPA